MKAHPDSLIGILHQAWQGRRSITVGICAGFVTGLLIFFCLTPVYEATMIIAPRSQASEERSMNILNDGSQSARGLSVSNEIPRDYIRFQQVLRENSAAKKLTSKPGIIESIRQDRKFRFTGRNEISVEDVSRYLKENIVLRPIGPTSSLLVSYKHPDPVFAKKMLDELHQVTDEMIRDDADRQTTKKVEYLQNALNSNYNPDHRKVLTDLLMLEERNRMFISMDQPFAAEIVEPATSSAKPIWPKAFIILPVFLFLGACGGFLYFYFREPRYTA